MLLKPWRRLLMVKRLACYIANNFSVNRWMLLYSLAFDASVCHVFSCIAECLHRLLLYNLVLLKYNREIISEIFMHIVNDYELDLLPSWWYWLCSILNPYFRMKSCKLPISMLCFLFFLSPPPSPLPFFIMFLHDAGRHHHL